MTDESNPANEGDTNVSPPFDPDALRSMYVPSDTILEARAAIDRNAQRAVDQFYDNYPQLYEWQRQTIGHLHNQTKPKTMEKKFMGKRIVDYTIADVVRKQPKWLSKNLDDDETAQLERNARYLGELVHFEPSIANESFVNMINRDTFYALETKDINAIVMKYIADKKKALEVDLPDGYDKFLDDQKEHFATENLDDLKDSIRETENSIAHCEDSISNYQRNINDQLRYLSDYQDRIADLEERVAKFDENETVDKQRMEYFKKITRTSPYWYAGSEVVLVQGNKIFDLVSKYDTQQAATYRASSNLRGYDTFISKKPHVLTEVIPNSGVARSMEMGYLFVSFQKNTNIIHKAGFIFGKPKSSSQHPHISSGGSVCWGSSSSTYTNLCKDAGYKIEEVLQLFDQTVSQYNSGSPYITYARLKRHINTNGVYASLLSGYSYDLMPKSFLPAEICAKYEEAKARQAIAQEYIDALVTFPTSDSAERTFLNNIQRFDEVVNGVFVSKSTAKSIVISLVTSSSVRGQVPRTTVEFDGLIGYHSDAAGHAVNKLMSLDGYADSNLNFSLEYILKRKFDRIQRNTQAFAYYTLPKGTVLLVDDYEKATLEAVELTPYSTNPNFIVKKGDEYKRYSSHDINMIGIWELPKDTPTDSLLSYLMYSSKSYKQGDASEERNADQSA